MAAVSHPPYSVTTVVRTARDTGERLSAVRPGDPCGCGSRTEVTVDLEARHQEILGFGGAFTESAAFVIAHMDEAKRREIIEAYFHPDRGLGYTLCRTHMNSCDFSLGNYSCDDVAGDTELKYFNIDRDKRYLLPCIKEALAVGGAGLKLFVSPWSPPGWMKTNNRMNNGGRLKPKCRAAWAAFYARFIRAYEAEGVPIWGLTVQNEPEAAQTWDSCLYTPEEERDFIRDFLGPLLAREGLADKRIIAWDHNRDRLFERARIMMADEEAAGYVWGMGFHWYSGEDFEEVARTRAAFPDKGLLFTEGCLEGGAKLGRWDRGEYYAHQMIGDLTHGTNGWVDWNMVLDPTGGPNHAGNLCDAPVIADPIAQAVHYQSSYYYIGHFSRYVRPGAFRLDCRTEAGDLEAAAFANPDVSVVAVVLNRSDREYHVGLNMGPRSLPVRSPAHSILSVVCK